MLPPERRLPDVRRLIEQEHYFVIHAPRQVGKTTTFRSLAQRLTAEGRYTALITSCETGQTLSPDLEGSIAAVLDTLRQNAEEYLPEELRPPAVDSGLSPRTRLRDLLVRWARQSPRPVVLFLDEIDALMDEALISVLRQLRSGYDARPRGFPQTVALIGLRDVRDYRLPSRAGAVSLGTSSPFNIKVESLTLRYFSAAEVAELYAQHTEATGQAFTAEAPDLAWELTRGQPWLVNALARQAVEKLAPDASIPITARTIAAAKEALIVRRDTHLDSLIDRLREPRVRRVIGPILAGDLLSPEVLDDDLRFVKDLGLVSSGAGGLEIANPIYREIIPRALTDLMEASLALPRPSYLDTSGGLDFDRLLADFRAFWLEHAESFLNRAPYSEAAAQLVFMAFLHKVVNAGGTIDREYAVGRGRIDLCVRWPRPAGDAAAGPRGPESVDRLAVELKVWRDNTAGDPVERGLTQLTCYLERLELDRGTLIVFDDRSDAAPLPQRATTEELERDGRRIVVMRL